MQLNAEVPTFAMVAVNPGLVVGALHDSEKFKQSEIAVSVHHSCLPRSLVTSLTKKNCAPYLGDHWRKTKNSLVGDTLIHLVLISDTKATERVVFTYEVMHG